MKKNHSVHKKRNLRMQNTSVEKSLGGLDVAKVSQHERWKVEERCFCLKCAEKHVCL